LHEPLKTGRTSRLTMLLENLYALADFKRLSKAIRRRLGLRQKTNMRALKELAVPPFTPFERPFTSPEELVALMPREMETIVLRSQGLLSFQEFPPRLSGTTGVALALLIVALDDWLSKNEHPNWSGDAIFAVCKKSR